MIRYACPSYAAAGARHSRGKIRPAVCGRRAAAHQVEMKSCPHLPRTGRLLLPNGNCHPATGNGNLPSTRRCSAGENGRLRQPCRNAPDLPSGWIYGLPHHRLQVVQPALIGEAGRNVPLECRMMRKVFRVRLHSYISPDSSLRAKSYSRATWLRSRSCRVVMSVIVL